MADLLTQDLASNWSSSWPLLDWKKKNQDWTVAKGLQILLTISIGVSNAVVDSAAKIILPYKKITN